MTGADERAQRGRSIAEVLLVLAILAAVAAVVTIALRSVGG